jgi:hypothetical protein
MMTNTLKQHLQHLHLSGLLSSLELRLQEAEANRLPHAQFLELLLQDEINVRHKNGASCSVMCPLPAPFSTGCSITPRLYRSTGAATDSSHPSSSHQAKSNLTTFFENLQSKT